jgi:hypothetical protein
MTVKGLGFFLKPCCLRNSSEPPVLSLSPIPEAVYDEAIVNEDVVKLPTRVLHG